MAENTTQTQNITPVEPQKRVIKKKPTSKKTSIVVTKGTENTLKEWLKKYGKIIDLAVKRNMNESDTSNIINDMLGEVFGYDKFFEVTTEYKIKWQYADYGVKMDEKLVFLIEVKAIWVSLNDNHIFQASSYASTEWVEWVILTNLREWNVYHLSFGSRIDQELVLSIDFQNEMKNAKFMEKLACIHKEGFKKNFLKALWSQKVAMSGTNFKKVLTSQPVLKVIQKELSKASGIKIGENDISKMLIDLFEC
jgi:predicted type IV restriction endonuclease